MKIDIKTNTIIQADIDEIEAFRILCKTLHMDFVLDEDTNYFVGKKEYGENAVYEIGITDEDEGYVDDRGDLFVALRNVAVNIVPNVGFRNADYIYSK